MLQRFFKFDELNANLKQETLAGITTFLTMSYIIIVNPKILEAAGIPFGPSMAATILSAFFGTLLMGIYAKRPFAVAPYMGENAFVAFTVVKVMGFSWQTALGAIFIGGVLFALLTIVKIRSWLANAIPENLKIGFAVGIGLFLTFIGLNETGIVTIGSPGAPVQVGNLNEAKILLAILGFIIIGFLMIKRINGAILISILLITFISIISGMQSLPEKFFSLPPDITPLLFHLDIPGALTWGFFSVVLTVFVMDFVDTMGTLLGLSYKANLLNDKGELPEIEKPMLVDALATIAASLLGTTTTGAYIESATGIEAGGKTGFTAVVVSILFLLALFFEPIFSVIPAYAYGPSLIIVGMLMITAVRKISFDDLTELIPVFCLIIMMSFTYNIGIGMTAGFVIYSLIKVLSGRYREVSAGMWILTLLSCLFFIFYPY
ncbi:MAG: NCS2 family permease [Ignavibacteriaceae bacterium]|nr:NCS2 family permease [Ignavibacteriaceae bacterium]